MKGLSKFSTKPKTHTCKVNFEDTLLAKKREYKDINGDA